MIKGGDALAFSYKPLWKLLIDKDMSKEEFKKKVNISHSTIIKMNKGEYVAMEILDRICNYFSCNLSDIVEHLPNNKQ